MGAKPQISEHEQALLDLSKDRRLAHSVLFKHRHPLETPPFHGEMIDDFHGPIQKLVDEAFRGGGKSTIGEEGTCLGALYNDFFNCVIVSSTEKRAGERLEAIKHEIENNDLLIELFGAQVGSIWQAQKIVLQNGVCIQALGVGQAVRGIKHHQFRPDMLWIDDIEDEESVKTPEACHERLKWLYSTLLPVCAKDARIRVTGNRLSPDAVVTKLAEDPSWISRRYPISYVDIETAEEKATWPEFRDMDWVRTTRAEYERLGLDQAWASEFMCEAISQAVKPFKVDDYRVVPRVRTWEPVYVMYDPAKTTKNLRHQSHTAKVAFSWIGHKIVVWDGWARPIPPSELIDDIFLTDREFSPVAIKVEENGLEEWLNEPLRIEQERRKIFLPHLGAERAPRDKDAFIRSLQPWFSSNQVEFAKDIGEARSQLINYPSGRKDWLNVLAYALRLRPGDPIYEGFSQENIADDLEANYRSKRYLCLNADGACVTAALVQFDGTLSVIADWILSGDAHQCVETICRLASLVGGAIDIVVPPKEADQFKAKGLIAALVRIPKSYRVGFTPETGRAEIRDFIALRTSRPLLQVSTQATWTLRAFSGGYHRKQKGPGSMDGIPEPGAYATLMEAIESFAAIMRVGVEDTPNISGHMRTGRDGRRYHALIGDRHDRRDDRADPQLG